MSTGILSGVAGSARRVQSIYTGVGGSARKVAKVYAGVNGIARLSWERASSGPLPLNPVFGENTWEQIGAAIANDEIPDSWAVGDEKEVLLSNNWGTTLQIYGIKHDDLPGGGKASFTLGMKHTSWWRQNMNATHTNVGGFASSHLAAWLDHNFQHLLPQALVAIIKPVLKNTSLGDMSPTIQADSIRFFTFSEIEVFGATTASFPGEGLRYEIFTQGLTDVIKIEHNGTGQPREWWLRSPYAGNAAMFCTISPSGSVSRLNAGMNRDICFGLCI